MSGCEVISKNVVDIGVYTWHQISHCSVANLSIYAAMILADTVCK